jgi:hypothetical protein
LIGREALSFSDFAARKHIILDGFPWKTNATAATQGDRKA